MCRPASTLFLLLATLVASNLAAGADSDVHRYTHQTWQTENGLPQNSVHAIVQAHDGYLWFGTEGGLSRFDGLQFAVFDSQNTPALKSNNVRALVEDRQHNLWIATADGLVRMRDGQFTRFTTAQGLPDNNVWALFRDRQDRLWALTPEGVAHLQGERFLIDAQTKLRAGSISAMAEDGEGNLWLGTEDGLKVGRPKKSPEPLLPIELSKANIQDLMVDRRGRIWVATSEELLVWAQGRVTVLNGLPNRKITTLYEDREGNIWVGTEAGGAEILGGDTQRVRLPEELSRGLILSFLQDREGNIWSGTDAAGVTVLRDQKFRTYTHANGLPDDLLRCVFQDRNGALWIGTNGNGLIHFQDGKTSSFGTAEGLSSNVVLSLAEDGGGNLLVGTPDGLNFLDGRTVRTITSADALPDDFIRSVYRDTDDTLWLGTRRGLAHISSGHVATFSTTAGLPSDLVGSVLRGKDGCLWIGTLKGLACLQNGTISSRLNGHGFPDAAITALYEDKEGALWVGSAEQGMARVVDGKAFRFPDHMRLPKTIFAIAEDSHRQLWITSPNGLICVRKDELNAAALGQKRGVSVASYGTTDGLTVNEFSGGGYPTVWKDGNGTLWFVTAKGLLSLDAAHSAPNRLPPPAVIEHVSVDDRTLPPASATDLAPGLSRLAFEYAGLSFVSPQKVRFRYRLEGFDRDWIEAGTRRVAYYTNLSPGRYRFVVLACNGDGIWNTKGAALAFRLRPHFYQTIWFYVAMLLLVMGLAYAVYRWRVQQVQAQFSAVLAERTRIAREIHDTLAQDFVAVSVQLELVNRVLPTSVESAGELLSQTRVLVQDSLAEARRSIWDLRSASNLDEGLPDRLSKVLREAVKSSGLEFRFNTTGAYRPLPARVEGELARIAQEAVVNVVRHAEAKRLDVTLAYDSTKAYMTIKDNGRGFTVAPDLRGPAGHFGLRGMRERAEAIGARLTVTSSEGNGTKVSVEVRL